MGDADAPEQDEQAAPAPRAAADAEARPAKPRGRFLAALALLIALAALGLGGYLYYLLVYQNPAAMLEARLQIAETAVRAEEDALERLAAEQRAAFERLEAEQQALVRAAEERVGAAMNELTRQAPPSTREWEIAEVAYLLRIANHRLLMERDVEGARKLLEAADQILLELDDFGLYPVRARLAEEILALANVRSTDLQGVYLKLEAVKARLEALPLRPSVRSRAQEPQAPEAPAAGLWDALVAQLSGYLRIRRVEGDLKPLLPPEEADYLEQNLRLSLERAQLAALRREQVVYEQSLGAAARWITSYLDPEDAGVRHVQEELETLSAIVLSEELPDISGSLNALRKASAGAP